MSRKKVEENNEIVEVEPDFIAEPDEESDTIYEPGMAPLAAENTAATNNEEETGEFIVLKKGATFRTGAYVFVKNEPVPVDTKMAEKLMNTGFFERS